MFAFGNPEDTAALFLQTRLAMTGPEVPDCHVDEMSEEDIRIAMAYLYGAVADGLREGLDPQAIEILTQWYDQAFLALAAVSEDFLERISAGAIIPPQGVSHRPRYLVLAGLASED